MKTNETKSNGTRTAFSYVRWSSGKQTDGDSLRRQLELAKKVCQENGWILDTSLEPDAGLSGYKDENWLEGSLGRFAALAKDGKLPKGSILIIERFDRFSRAPFDVVEDRVKELLRAGVSIKSCMGFQTFLEPGDESNLVKRLTLMVEMEQANQFSLNLSNKIKAAREGLEAKFNKGEHVNFGNYPSWIDWNDTTKSYELNEHVSTVQEIFRRYVEGESQNHIAKDFNARNVPTFRKSKMGWQNGQISNVLTNRAVLGEFKGRQNYFPKVEGIDETTFNRVQGLVSKNSQRRGHRSTITNILKGVVCCSHCGGPVSMTTNGSGIKIYRCSNSHYSKCNVEGSMTVSDVENLVFLTAVQKSPVDFIGSNNRAIALEIEAAEGRIAQLSKSINRNVSLLSVVDDSQAEEIKTNIQNLTEQRKAEQSTVETLKGKIAAVHGVSVSWNNIVNLFNSDKETDHTEAADYQLKIQEQLKNEENRKKLVGLVPSLISKVVLDVKKNSMWVLGLDGSELTQELVID